MTKGDATSSGALSAERVARNDSGFRDANECIERAAEEYEISERVPFICERADPRCTTIIPLSLVEYEQIRAHHRWFLNAPGHEAAAGGWAKPVSSRDGWVIVEKIGQAGEIAEDMDSRQKVEDEHGRT
jgi:hypothetical protein